MPRDQNYFGRTPEIDELQTLLSRAVDAAQAIPRGTVSKRFDALVGLYVSQIVGAIVERRAPDA